MHAAIVDTLKSAEVTDKLTNVSAGYVVGNTPEELADVIRTERAKWGRVIKQSGVKLVL